MIPKTIIHLFSGGLDSTVLLYDLKRLGFEIHCVLFNYGQTHIRELDYARRHCDALGVMRTEVELYRVKNLFSRSALTDGQGGLVVPNRNAVMLNIAVSLAMSAGAESVSYACNADDAKLFPDCREAFVKALNATLKAAEVPVEIGAPYIKLTKKQIVAKAKEHGWPYEDTMSCYGGNNCGMCDACRKRAEAIA